MKLVRQAVLRSAALISIVGTVACGRTEPETVARLGEYDPFDPPEYYCAALCGDGECLAFSGESCETCLQDCGGGARCDPTTGAATFMPGSTSLAVGDVLEPGCIAGSVVANTERGASSGTAPLPFKPGVTRLLTAPAACGGIAESNSMVGAGVDARDGTLGTSLPCLTVGAEARGLPISVGLRYEVGRWQSTPSGAYRRPGSIDVGDFWFVSYSRRLHGAFPAYRSEAWSAGDLPASFTLYLEDYTSFTFDRVGTTHEYVQPGTTTDSAVAFARIADDSDSNASCAGPFGSQLIAPNDILVHYPDGTLDVFSGRDLTFKGHIDNHRNQLVVTYAMQDATTDGLECPGGPPGAQRGIKRIASIPAGEVEPAFWVDLEHEYVQVPRAGGFVEQWRLTRMRDSVGRVVQIDYGPRPSPTSITYFPGRPEAQQYGFDYDDRAIVSVIALPTPAADAAAGADNRVVVEHRHPTDLAVGGLSRVATQTRRIGGVDGRTTTFTWQDQTTSPFGLRVDYPNGDFRGIRHQTPQIDAQQGMVGSPDDRVAATYEVNATANPQTIFYDPDTKLVVQACDPLSPASVGSVPSPSDPPDRCVGYLYDANLNLERVVAPTESGGIAETTLTYRAYAPGNHYVPIGIESPSEVTTTFEYEAGSWLVGRMETVRMRTETDALGQSTSYVWCEGSSTCPAGRLQRIEGPLGATTSFEYAEDTGALASRSLPNGAQERFQYDLRGCLLEQTNLHGTRTVYEYDDASGLQGDCLPVREIANPDGGTDRVVTQYEYDPARLLARVVADLGGDDSNSDTAQQVSHAVVTPAGDVAPVWMGKAGTGSSFPAVQRREFDVHGAPTAVIEDSMGRTLAHAYTRASDGTTSIVTSRSGIAGTRSATYDASGRPRSLSDERGVTTSFAYYAATGRVEFEVLGSQAIGSRPASNLLTRFFYDVDGSIYRVERPDGVVEELEYDDLRRIEAINRSSGEDSNRLEVDYDPLGRIIDRRELRNGVLQREVVPAYEGNNGGGPRLQQTTLISFDPALGPDATTRYSYEPDWNSCAASTPGRCWAPIGVTSPRDVAGAGTANRAYSYDGLGRLDAVVEAAAAQDGSDATWTYRYDGLGCMRSIQGPGRSQSFVCDRFGRVTDETEGGPTGPRRSVTYYPDGILASLTDFDGSRTDYLLDATQWRVGSIVYSPAPNVEAPGNVAFTHYDNDAVHTMVDGSGSTTYEYDSANRLYRKTRVATNGPTTALTYERPPGSTLVASIDYWGTGRVDYTYDEHGRMETLAAFGGPTQTYGYRADGLLDTMSSSVMSMRLGYAETNGLPQLSSIRYVRGSDPNAVSSILSFGYGQVDPNGNIEKITEVWENETPMEHNFTYDRQDRLVGVQHWAIDWPDATAPLINHVNVYDARGNATSFMGKTSTFDGEDRMTSYGDAAAGWSGAPQYDDRRNLTCLPGEEGNCHCSNGRQDEDEQGVDCGGDDCESCACDDGGDPIPPPFVGTACPRAAGTLDWATLEAEVAQYDDPGRLTFGLSVPFSTPGCTATTVEVPVSDEGYTDYVVWRLGGAVNTAPDLPGVPPSLRNNWIFNPGYFAEGMMDFTYGHPAKAWSVVCSNWDGRCAIGTKGDGLADDPAEVCDMARMDPDPRLQQPGTDDSGQEIYDGRIRAFNRYERSSPDSSLPPGYQRYYDVVSVHSLGGSPGGLPVCDDSFRGGVYLVLQADTCE